MRIAYLVLLLAAVAVSVVSADVWSREKANDWYSKQPWPVGCNFIPSTAINQLEMFQPETFDLVTIDRELGYAQSLGFNSIRVFLHYMLWEGDKAGFLDRFDTFLAVSARHNISVMPVLFDDCWNSFPQKGKQPEPVPHVHNSGWLQSPGVRILRSPEKHILTKGYVQDLIRRFANDRRILFWDLYNEAGNVNVDGLVLPLVKLAFTWAREVNPSQPIASCVWTGIWKNSSELSELNKFILNNSDIVVFHNYETLYGFQKVYDALLQYGRPLICNEYMSRKSGSTFQHILPFMKEKRIGAYNWGLVSGKTQTIYPWDSWFIEYKAEPAEWFHDILRADGSPFSQEEVDLIKSLLLK